MTKILVLYYSKHGRTKLLARNIALGVEQQGASAIVRTVADVSAKTEEQLPSIPAEGDVFVSKGDLKNCDGLALGSPTHFGNMAAPMKYFIDSLTDIWFKGVLEDKPACVFTSSSSMHGGQESTLLSMMLPLFHHGMCILGLPYSQAELHTSTTGGSPYGATSVANNKNESLSEDEKSLAMAMGARLAEAATKLSQ